MVRAYPTSPKSGQSPGPGETDAPARRERGLFVQVPLGIFRDIRFLRLCKRLGISESDALALVVRLDICGMEQFKTGIVADLSPDELAGLLAWTGDGDALVAALVGVGLLAEDGDGWRIVGFEDRSGSIFIERRRDADRKRGQRGGKAGDSSPFAGHPQEVQGTSDGRPQDVHRPLQIERNLIELNKTESNRTSTPPVPLKGDVKGGFPPTPPSRPTSVGTTGVHDGGPSPWSLVSGEVAGDAGALTREAVPSPSPSTSARRADPSPVALAPPQGSAAARWSARFAETFPAAHRLSPLQRQLVEALRDGRALTVAQGAALTGCGEEPVGKNLRALVEMGVVERQGEGLKGSPFAYRLPGGMTEAPDAAS